MEIHWSREFPWSLGFYRGLLMEMFRSYVVVGVPNSNSSGTQGYSLVVFRVHTVQLLKFRALQLLGCSLSFPPLFFLPFPPPTSPNDNLWLSMIWRLFLTWAIFKGAGSTYQQFAVWVQVRHLGILILELPNKNLWNKLEELVE